jgi:hypothetical protein
MKSQSLRRCIKCERNMLRICITQINRQTVTFQITQEFYRRIVFISHLDDII